MSRSRQSTMIDLPSRRSRLSAHVEPSGLVQNVSVSDVVALVHRPSGIGEHQSFVGTGRSPKLEEVNRPYPRVERQLRRLTRQCRSFLF